MAESTIPVDLFNPGQVFACLGLVELCDHLLGNAEAAFDWTNPTRVIFRIRASGSEIPVERAVSFLRGARVISRSPSVELATDSWDVETERFDPTNGAFPFPQPTSPATLPAIITQGDYKIELSHWGDDFGTSGRDSVKFWAGAGGYPGAALAQDALALIKDMPASVASDPFNAHARQSSSFRFDWRRDYVPMDIGFSLNAHSSDRFSTIGFPIVEVLAAIGLTHARPKRHPKTKLTYSYSVIADRDPEVLLSPVLLRAALGGTGLPFLQRSFKMNLGWPGKENQARCITTVEELSIN